MEYLLKEDFILINRMTIKRHGGNFVPPENILNESGLEYVVEAVNAELFGSPIYPTIHEKAAVYMHSIISNHVFQDGNKRTGLEAALLFLKLNSYHLKSNLSRVNINSEMVPASGTTSNDILFHFTMEVASGKLDLKACQKWFFENIESAD